MTNNVFLLSRYRKRKENSFRSMGIDVLNRTENMKERRAKDF